MNAKLILVVKFDSPGIIRLRGPTLKRHTSHFQLPMRLNCTVQRHVTTQTVWDNEERHIAESREINIFYQLRHNTS